MTLTDQSRLAQIRAQVEQWIAMHPEAKEWDAAFLLRLLDEALREKEK